MMHGQKTSNYTFEYTPICLY